MSQRLQRQNPTSPHPSRLPTCPSFFMEQLFSVPSFLLRKLPLLSETPAHPLCQVAPIVLCKGLYTLYHNCLLIYLSTYWNKGSKTSKLSFILTPATQMHVSRKLRFRGSHYCFLTKCIKCLLCAWIFFKMFCL